MKTGKWKPHQQYRLAIEQKILSENMPDFAFYEPMGDTYVYGVWTSSRGRRYTIQITLPSAFPDECPGCYIVDPAPLACHDGTMINDHGNCHELHCWESDRGDWTKICTYKPANWSAAHSLEKVIQKALLWVEAYEAHLTTGRNVADFLLSVQ